MKMNKEVVMVRISDIIPNRFQPRLTFDEEALNELANSIKEHGIIQPLILRDLGSKYEIIAGERRYKASQLAGLTEVPAIVGSMDDQTSAELALIENIQRKDLSAIEEAKSYKIILDMGDFTQEQLAKRMGKSQSTVANKMRLLTLTNEAQMALMNNLISERHARCLLQVKDSDKQKEVLNKIIIERMNVRDTDDYIKNMLGIAKVEVENYESTTAEAPEEKTAIELPNIYKEEIPQLYNPQKTEEVAKVDIQETTVPQTDISKIELPNIDFPSVDKKEEPEKKDEIENPNVYAQGTNNDFVNILNLDKEEPVSSPIKNALNSLDIVSTESELFSGNDISVKEKEDSTEQNNNLQKVTKEENNMMKIKLATAIKLAQDSTEEIRKAGYTVTMAEVDTESDYQIIIKVQK